MAAPKHPQRIPQPNQQSSRPGQRQGGVVVSKTHSGPLPDPQTLREYDDLIPGSATEIIKMASDQAQHRREMERMALAADSSARDNQLQVEHQRIQGTIVTDRLGMILGWIVALACVAGAIWSAFADKPSVVTVAFLGLPIAGIINSIRKRT